MALDETDRAIIHALHVAGRAPFSRIGAVLGVSTQTVARRYHRLRTDAALRVVGLPDPHRTGVAQWMVRLTASPHTAQDLAQAVARRPDTSWVKLASGGTEIVTIVHTSAVSSHSLLLRDIPRTASITSVAAHYVLHTYLGGPIAWRGRTDTLTAEQENLLRGKETRSGQQIADTDRDLLAALQRDGRAGLADLAAATGWAPATVARRIADLQASGALFFDVEVDNTLLGATTQALLWMAVAPARLETVATALATHDELAFVAATTGPTNLCAHVVCADPPALHHYLTRRLGALTDIDSIETAPVLRTLKAGGQLGSVP